MGEGRKEGGSLHYNPEGGRGASDPVHVCVPVRVC